jgi:hypothetical protein
MNTITPQEAKQITEEAYIFAFSMLENYKTMYMQAVNENLPTFRAPFNQFAHMYQLLGPEFTEVVGPNNDTLYSLAWLDLGTEPIVLALPDFPDNTCSPVPAGTAPRQKGSTVYVARKGASLCCWGVQP